VATGTGIFIRWLQYQTEQYKILFQQ